MGTTLTGTTPQDTYDSLIKVTDNGPLSATGKYLSDGLGNDSALALSTATVGVGTASNSYTSAGRGNLNIAGSAGAIIGFQIGGTPKGYVFHDSTNLQLWNEVAGDLLFGANATERMRILSGGNVGIGTSAPTTKLTVGGVIRLLDGSLTGTGGVELSSEAFYGFAAQATAYKFRNSSNTATYISVDSDGLKFGSDTAAANALDDYEEGTWTMGVSFGGASVGVTTSNNTGTYTKIGRQVTVNGLLQLTSKGSSTGSARITGLPFTIGTGNSFYSTAGLQLGNVTFTNQYSAIGVVNTTTIELYEATILGVITNLTNSDFANNSDAVVSLTYFV